MASTAFWTAFGGTAATVGTINAVQLPGIYIFFRANGPGRGAAAAPQAAATPAAPPAIEGSVGSVVDSIGLEVKSLGDTLAKLRALGVTPEPGATATVASVTSPEKVKVVLTEDSSLRTPSASNELLLKVSNPSDEAAWYVKWFGATARPMANGDVIAELPGMNMRFVKTSETLAGTRGRGLDHIGLDVHDLQAALAKMQDGGVTVNSAYRAANIGFITALAFVTDPSGTYIELNEGFDGH